MDETRNSVVKSYLFFSIEDLKEDQLRVYIVGKDPDFTEEVFEYLQLRLTAHWYTLLLLFFFLFELVYVFVKGASYLF